ncbi:MAG: fused MFS/spermidine synthase [Mycobacteriales bacterium]
MSGPVPGRYPVRFGEAELLQDLDAEDGWLLSVDGVAQSYVDRADPTHLEFDYVRLMGDVVDGLPDGPLTAVHLGGGGCTLARYVAATRPGSRQLVVEVDEQLAELVRTSFGTRGFRLRIGDARRELPTLRQGESDLVVADVFESSLVPVHVTTSEWVQQVQRLLRPGGVYVVNVADGGPLAFARAQVATLLAAFEHVLLLADPSVLRGRRFANLVLAGSQARLPEAELTRTVSRAAGRARLVSGNDLRDFTGGAAPVTDATARSVPRPPPDLFRR